MTTANNEIGEFLVSRGGPFYELQKRLRLLREDEPCLNTRAAIFVGLAWGVPLLLSLMAGNAFGAFSEKPFLLHPTAWARFFIAVGIFILVEGYVEKRLGAILRQFLQAPLLAPASLKAAAKSVGRALDRRNSQLAEAVCLTFAIVLTIGSAYNLFATHTSSWLVQSAADGKSLTMAGWWCVVFSSSIFFFLIARWIWRLVVWGLLLRELAALELRLVVTHPDGYGGLGFVGEFPNAYTPLVFALGCVNGAVIAEALIKGTIAAATYGYVMAGWLIVVHVLLALPLTAFSAPLSDLKEQTLLLSGALATRHFRATERSALGRNVCAATDASSETADEVANPSTIFTAAKKLPTFLFSRSTLLPVSAAALLPLVAAGATQLPFEELLKILKRLVLL